MLVVSIEDVEFLKEHIENVDELINKDTRKPLLRELYDVIMYKGFDNEFYNDFGKKAQQVYDNIQSNN